MPLSTQIPIGQPENLWVSHVTINAGSGNGVSIDDPVIDPDGLIGTVTEVAADSAIVTLINDPTSGVSARDSASRETGIIVPQPGSPGQLVMSFVSRPSEVKVGDLIVTAGERATANASLFLSMPESCRTVSSTIFRPYRPHRSNL